MLALTKTRDEEHVAPSGSLFSLFLSLMTPSAHFLQVPASQTDRGQVGSVGVGGGTGGAGSELEFVSRGVCVCLPLPGVMQGSPAGMLMQEHAAFVLCGGGGSDC